MTKTFGEWLRKRRQEARLSQDELAARAGVSKSYISTLERDAPHPKTGAPPQPTRETVDALAQALGIPIPVARDAAYGSGPIALASSEEMPEEINEHLQRYLRAWIAASPELRARIQQVFEAQLQSIEASVYLDHSSRPTPTEKEDGQDPKEKDSKS